MTKSEMWQILVERHPEFKDDEYVLKQRARGLLKLIEQAWDEGKKVGVEEGRAAHSDIFGGIFR